MNKSFLNGLRALGVPALVIMACFTCLVVSSCTQDEIVYSDLSPSSPEAQMFHS
ncbi:MAG: hypothetical protein LBG59_01445 [Candidatus Peribacteria bacterium]|nr:hypothetical protein [Candidatus Peribacteria bacterium]